MFTIDLLLIQSHLTQMRKPSFYVVQKGEVSKIMG